MNKYFVLVVFLLKIELLSAQNILSYKSSDSIFEILKDTTKDWQFPLISYSFIGNYKNLLKEWDEKNKQNTQQQRISTDILSQYIPTDAINFIGEKSKNEQLILINEAHHIPLHRVFTSQLLKQLYDAGFRYLGLETLFNGETDTDLELNIRKYPIVKSGLFSREPQFGNLIREAIKLGFTVFPYEAKSKDFKSRELEQAQNIFKVLQKDPNAKILVHCGYGHIIEDMGNENFIFMAQHLKKLSGIDPLTIDQTTLAESANPSFEHPNYRGFKFEKSAIFVDNNNKTLALKSKYFHPHDILVYHPPTTYISGRPNWLLRNDEWKLVKVPFKKIKIDYPVLGFIYAKTDKFDRNTSVNDDLQPIPIDLIELSSEKDLKSFVLPKGKFILKVINDSGNVQIINL
jgi:hypothetical protein